MSDDTIDDINNKVWLTRPNNKRRSVIDDDDDDEKPTLPLDKTSTDVSMVDGSNIEDCRCNGASDGDPMNKKQRTAIDGEDEEALEGNITKGSNIDNIEDNGASDEDKTDIESFANTEDLKELIDHCSGHNYNIGVQPIIPSHNSQNDNGTATPKSVCNVGPRNEDEFCWSGDDGDDDDDDNDTRSATQVLFDETEDVDDDEETQSEPGPKAVPRIKDEFQLVGYVSVDIRSDDYKAKYTLEVRLPSCTICFWLPLS
jgi:hypothetical protein